MDYYMLGRRIPEPTPQQARRNRKRFFWGFAICTTLIIGLSEIGYTPPPVVTVVGPPPKSEVDLLRERCDELTADKDLRFAMYGAVTGWGDNPNACGSGPTATDIEMICPLNTGDGYRVACNHARYVYNVVDYGGRWVTIYLPPTRR